jgi:hypothetical protein
MTDGGSSVDDGSSVLGINVLCMYVLHNSSRFLLVENSVFALFINFQLRV